MSDKEEIIELVGLWGECWCAVLDSPLSKDMSMVTDAAAHMKKMVMFKDVATTIFIEVVRRRAKKGGR